MGNAESSTHDVDTDAGYVAGAAPPQERTPRLKMLCLHGHGSNDAALQLRPLQCFTTQSGEKGGGAEV